MVEIKAVVHRRICGPHDAYVQAVTWNFHLELWGLSWYSSANSLWHKP